MPGLCSALMPCIPVRVGDEHLLVMWIRRGHILHRQLAVNGLSDLSYLSTAL